MKWDDPPRGRPTWTGSSSLQAGKKIGEKRKKEGANPSFPGPIAVWREHGSKIASLSRSGLLDWMFPIPISHPPPDDQLFTRKHDSMNVLLNLAGMLLYWVVSFVLLPLLALLQVVLVTWKGLRLLSTWQVSLPRSAWMGSLLHLPALPRKRVAALWTRLLSH
jgi:hypothetical protein